MIKVSIIVPVYNVENYVARCLDSLVNQTLKEIEIIIVNDGSTDGSGEICKKYAKRYKNIKYIKQKNQGLSGARNTGIEVARGEYIGFVDSDDFVELDMFEFLYDNAKKHDVKIMACGHQTYYEDGTTKLNTKKGIDKFYDLDEALDNFLMQEYFDVVTWNKLYQCDLFSDVRFPVGKIYEDIQTIYKLIERAGGIYLDSKPKYYYSRRKNSISQAHFGSETMELAKYVDDYVDKYSKKISHPKYIYLGQIRWNLVVVNKVLVADKRNLELMKRTRKMIKDHLTLVMFTDTINNVRKMQILLFCCSFNLYKQLYLKVTNKNKVDVE